MKPPMVASELAKMITLYEDEYKTCAEISVILNRHVGTIEKNLKKLGIKLRSYRDYYAAKVNDSYFEKIDTECKAYWFGYALADGCISQSAGDFRAFHFNLQRRDRVVLEKFTKHIEYSGEIRDYQRWNKDHTKLHDKSGVDFNNKIFCSHLMTKGWFEFKQQDDPSIALSVINAELINHFIRGFFDGDGCISESKKNGKCYFNFAGSKNNLDYIEDMIINYLGFNKKNPKKSKTTASYRMGWNGNRQVALFGEWLYSNATLYLDRKFVKFSKLSDALQKLPQFEFDDQNGFIYPLDYRAIKQLSQGERNKLIDHFERKISRRSWVSPQYSDAQLRLDYVKIKEEDMLYYINDGKTMLSGKPKSFPGKQLLLHFQSHFWDTHYKSHMTIVDGWSNKKVRRNAIENMFNTRGSRPSLARYVRELNFAGARRVSHFHPGFARAIINQFAPFAKNMFDPCAGWGARMLAASSFGMDYEACDPNPKTFDGLALMAKFIDYKPTIYNIPFEEFEFKQQYDLIFTSPPYFNIERYKHGKQSYNGKSTYEQWYYEFMVGLIDKCLTATDTFLLHVSDKICNSIMKTYPNSVACQVSLQKSPGAPKSYEYLVAVFGDVVS